MRRIYDGLTILLKYGEGSICAEHDEIWAGGDDSIPENMSKDDLDKLKDLGWTYEEGFGWHHFT